MYASGQAVVHPRLSVLSTSSLPSSSASTSSDPNTPPSSRYSLPPVPSSSATAYSTSSSATAFTSTGTTAVATNLVRPNIYDRPLNKTRNAEVSLPAFAFLFGEMVQYTQKRVGGIADFERKLNTLGYRIGMKLLELHTWRMEGTSKQPKRDVRFLPALSALGGPIWKAAFGKAADQIQKSMEKDDEFMLIENDPAITKFISVSRDMSSLSCSALAAGIVEAVLDGLGFPARVTAHNVPTEQYPNCTTILIKLDRSVLEREDALKYDP